MQSKIYSIYLSIVQTYKCIYQVRTELGSKIGLQNLIIITQKLLSESFSNQVFLAFTQE